MDSADFPKPPRKEPPKFEPEKDLCNLSGQIANLLGELDSRTNVPIPTGDQWVSILPPNPERDIDVEKVTNGEDIYFMVTDKIGITEPTGQTQGQTTYYYHPTNNGQELGMDAFMDSEIVEMLTQKEAEGVKVVSEAYKINNSVYTFKPDGTIGKEVQVPNFANPGQPSDLTPKPIESDMEYAVIGGALQRIKASLEKELGASA